MKRKFKHINTGIIGTCKDDHWLHYERVYGNIASCESISMDLVNNSKDWIEIIQEYTILSFRFKSNSAYPGSIWSLFKNGKYGHDYGAYSLESMLSNNMDSNKEIYSIRRESDGEVFTLGDKIKLSSCDKCGSGILQEIEFEIALSDKGTGRLSFVHIIPLIGKWLEIDNLIKIKSESIEDYVQNQINLGNIHKHDRTWLEEICKYWKNK